MSAALFNFIPLSSGKVEFYVRTGVLYSHTRWVFPWNVCLSISKVSRHLQIIEECSPDVECIPGFSRLEHRVFVSSAESLFSVLVCGRCVCVKPLYFRVCVSASLFLDTCVNVHMCVTKMSMNIFVFLSHCCLGPLCVMSMLGSLCNWREPLQAPRHMELSSFGCLSVHISIHFNCPESWLMDSHYYLLHGLSVGLNTLICNKLWDRADPWLWDWPHKAKNMWP